MKQAQLYLFTICRSTNRYDFGAEQRRIAGDVKRAVGRVLKKSGLSGEFAYADGRVPSSAYAFEAYATYAASREIFSEVPNIESYRPVSLSLKALHKLL